jgi:hypothetical protein
MKALQHHANLTAFEALICAVYRKDSRKDSFMLHASTTESQSFSVLSCCQAGFLNNIKDFNSSIYEDVCAF